MLTVGRLASAAPWLMMGRFESGVLRLQQALEVGSFAITAEVMPPRGGDVSRTLAHARQLKGLVHALNVTDGSRAVMRMSSLAVVLTSKKTSSTTSPRPGANRARASNPSFIRRRWKKASLPQQW